MPDTRLLSSDTAEKAAVPEERRLESSAEGRESDVSLMHRAAGGEATAYASLFRRHADRIWQMAFLILRSAGSADEILQGTYHRGLAHIRTYRGEAESRAWLSSIALSLCRQWLRDRGKGLGSGTEASLPPDWESLTAGVHREGHQALMVAMGYLTEAQREVFVLHYVDELPYEDVARMLNIRAGAARALAHRAKLMLHKKLGGDFERTLYP